MFGFNCNSTTDRHFAGCAKGASANSDNLLNSSEVAEWLGPSESCVKDDCTRSKPRLPIVQLGSCRYPIRRFIRWQI